MSAMRSDDERALEEALSAAEGQADRIARAAGFIVDRFQRAGIAPVVVSGGAAVVLATASNFATFDIDLITPEADRLDAVLEELGFHRRNARQHIWTNERLGLVVQCRLRSCRPTRRPTASRHRRAAWSRSGR